MGRRQQPRANSVAERRCGGRPGRSLLLAPALATVLAACPAFLLAPGAEGTGPVDEEDGLPSTTEECVALAERLGVEGGSPAELQLALRALERAETLGGPDDDLAVEQARVLTRLAASLGKSTKSVRWLDRGDRVAKRILASTPDRVEGHYFKAVFLGLRAQIQEVGGLDLLPEMVASARRAVEIDETYDDGGPLIALGVVLVKAPAWPHGVGDPDEGIEVLERAVALSDYPLNRLMLGSALIEVGQKTAGCRELAAVLAAPKRGRWAKTGEQHREAAQLLLRTSRCPRVSASP